MNWIKCRHRMPNYDVDVLITDGEQIVMAYLDYDTDDFSGNRFDLFNASNDGKFCPEIINVTHWMPLPTLPED